MALLAGISGHADRDGLLNWVASFEQKPAVVFVNHGDDESCTGLAEAVSEKFSLQACAPYSGSEFDLLKGEWIRLTEPVYRQKQSGESARDAAPRSRRDDVFRDLISAVKKLTVYAESLKGHSNSELKKLTKRILELTEK